MAARLEGRPSMALEHVVGNGAWVLSLERFRAVRAGRVLDQDVCVVWRIVDGRCVEVRSRFADQAACDRFWTSP
jgi:ketosteroid isomerase-like protein